MKRCAEEEIKTIENLHDELEDGACIVETDEQASLIVLDYDKYQFLIEMLDADNAGVAAKPIGVKIVADQDFDLSEEEFESLKTQLVDALEASFYHKNNKKKEEMN